MFPISNVSIHLQVQSHEPEQSQGLVFLLNELLQKIHATMQADGIPQGSQDILDQLSPEERFQAVIQEFPIKSLNNVKFLFEIVNDLTQGNQIKLALATLCRLSQGLKENPIRLPSQYHHISKMAIHNVLPHMSQIMSVEEESNYIVQLGELHERCCYKKYIELNTHNIAFRSIKFALEKQNPDRAWEIFKRFDSQRVINYGDTFQLILDNLLNNYRKTIEKMDRTLENYIPVSVRNIISEYIAPECITASIRCRAYWQEAVTWCQNISPSSDEFHSLRIAHIASRYLKFPKDLLGIIAEYVQEPTLELIPYASCLLSYWKHLAKRPLNLEQLREQWNRWKAIAEETAKSTTLKQLPWK